MTFNYTAGDSEVNSSLVYEAYYNSATRELVVVLDSEDGYLYKGVPQHVYDELVSGRVSAGRYYGKTIKRGYGPGERLGYVGLDNEDYFVYAYPAPSMEAVGTPKGLSYASDAKVDGSPVVSLGADGTSRFVDLAPKAEEPREVTYRHAVNFTVDGLGNDVRVYNVETTSVDKAVDALSEATAALGLDVNVKGVWVSFE